MNAVAVVARSWESRCLLPRPCVHTIPFANAKNPTGVDAQVGRSLGDDALPECSDRGSRLRAGDQRCGIPPALRSAAARGGHRTLTGVTTDADGQGSHGGHARDARPRGGEPGQVAVGRPRHGRASGPRPHSPERQTRDAASAGGKHLDCGVHRSDHGIRE